MTSDIQKVMEMLTEGNITAEEATELLEALQAKQAPQNEKASSAPGRKLHILIKDDEKEVVNINIPIRFFQWLFQVGYDIAKNIPEASTYLEDIDMDQIQEAIQSNKHGTIINMTTDEGIEINISIV